MLRSQASDPGPKPPGLRWLIDLAEQWVEVQDATRRRRTADRIYRDLRHERISRQRAVEELRKLNKRQKGGWLASQLLVSNDRT